MPKSHDEELVEIRLMLAQYVSAIMRGDNRLPHGKVIEAASRLDGVIRCRADEAAKQPKRSPARSTKK